MNDITQRLKHIIVNELDVKADMESLRDDVSLFEGGIGLDSIAIMEFISILEQQFGFQFSDEELNLEPFQTLSKLSEFVEKKLATTQE